MASSPTVALLRPCTATQRPWLDREALRIAAGVHGASRESLRLRVFLAHVNSGFPEDVAAQDAETALAYLDARLAQIDALRSEPPPTIDGGARWQA